MKHLAAALILAASPALAEVDVTARALFDIRVASNPATHIRIFETHSSTTLERDETGAGFTATFAGLAPDPVEFETVTPWGGDGAFVNRHVAGAIAVVPDTDTGNQLTRGILKSTLDVENLGPDVEQAVLTVSYDLAVNLINDMPDAASAGRVDILFELNGEQVGYATLDARSPTDPSQVRDVFAYQFQIDPGARPAQITITVATVAFAMQP